MPGPDWAWRPVVMISLATVAFALLIDRWGLAGSMLVSMTLAALGTPQTRWGKYAMFAAIMLAIGTALFVWGLGMPIEVLPRELSWR
jgi:putative tricarboxylic transport membrane protein